jgi:hypothetical protein
METECNATQLEFKGVGRRKVTAEFDGGRLSSDGGAVLLRELDLSLGIVARLARCFADGRDESRVEHSVETLLRQRVFGIALGYEDLNDHDELMRDPLLALSSGKRDVDGASRRRAADVGKALASSSTLNRMELASDQIDAAERYKKIAYDSKAIEALLVDVFLDSYDTPPEEIVLDFDATDDPLHGDQEGKFFHGYYRCYCYMPLYVTCGDHVLASKLRTSDRDGADGALDELARIAARIRGRWPDTRIIVRADSGFCRDAIMAWCERNGVYYVLGLAKNARLHHRILWQLHQARCLHKDSGRAARVFTEFRYRTLSSWTKSRRVIAKAEHLAKGANPRFIVTNLPGHVWRSRELYEDLYCARGDMENRIKEQQLDLFADRTSAGTMRANQLRLWFSTFAYVLLSALRRIALQGTRLANATCGTLRLKLLKIGARIKTSVRRFMIHLASACPYQDIFRQALSRIHAYPLRV